MDTGCWSSISNREQNQQQHQQQRPNKIIHMKDNKTKQIFMNWRGGVQQSLPPTPDTIVTSTATTTTTSTTTTVARNNYLLTYSNEVQSSTLAGNWYFGYPTEPHRVVALRVISMFSLLSLHPFCRCWLRNSFEFDLFIFQFVSVLCFFFHFFVNGNLFWIYSSIPFK